MRKLMRVGVWLLLPILGAAWVAVISGAISVMGNLRDRGELVDAASITTLSAFFVVLALAVAAVVLDATGRPRLGTATRVVALVVTITALVVAGVLMSRVLSAQILGARRGGRSSGVSDVSGASR